MKFWFFNGLVVEQVVCLFGIHCEDNAGLELKETCQPLPIGGFKVIHHQTQLFVLPCIPGRTRTCCAIAAVYLSFPISHGF